MEAAAAMLREKHWHMGRMTAAELEGEMQRRWHKAWVEFEEVCIAWDEQDAAFHMEE